MKLSSHCKCSWNRASYTSCICLIFGVVQGAWPWAPLARATTLMGTKWTFSMIYTGLFPQRITPTDDYSLLSIFIQFMFQVGRSHHSWVLDTNSFSHCHYTPGFISLMFSPITIYHSVGTVQHHHQSYQGHKVIKVRSPSSMPGVIREALGRRQVPRFIYVLRVNSQMRWWCASSCSACV